MSVSKEEKTYGVKAPGTANKMTFLLAVNSLMFILFAGESSNNSTDGILSPSCKHNNQQFSLIPLYFYAKSCRKVQNISCFLLSRIAFRILRLQSFVFLAFRNKLCNNNQRFSLTLICTILVVVIERLRIWDAVLNATWLTFNREFINDEEIGENRRMIKSLKRRFRPWIELLFCRLRECKLGVKIKSLNDWQLFFDE